MAKNWANDVPDEGRSPELGYRMAAEGIQFPWRWNGGTTSTVLDVIWGMSANVSWSGFQHAASRSRSAAESGMAGKGMAGRYSRESAGQ